MYIIQELNQEINRKRGIEMIKNLKGGARFNIELTKQEIELIECLIDIKIESNEDLNYAISVILEQVK